MQLKSTQYKTRHKKTQTGFTLMEILVTLGIMAILVAIAAPNFSDMIDNQYHRNYAKELNTLLQFARSAAVSKRQNVRVCSYKKLEGNNKDLECDNSNDWANGIIVFLDNDPNQRNCKNCVDNPNSGNGDQLLRRHPAPKDSVTVQAGLPDILFRASGEAGTSGTIQIKSDRQNIPDARIRIDLSGRTYLDS